MSERKVLNKYFPPDFDPNNIPKLRLEKNRQWNIRIMAPFNMRCSTCGEYIYKGKKFNSRKEDVEDDDYLGLKIFRFYIRCPRCVAEISFKTDPENCDYALEAGATRNFEALKTAETLAKKEIEEKEAEEKNNPMKMLENRTKASLREMEMLETLEDLKNLNSRHAEVDHENMIRMHKTYAETLAKLQEEEDDRLVNSLFGSEEQGGIKRLADDDDEEENKVQSRATSFKKICSSKPTDILTKNPEDVIDNSFPKPKAGPVKSSKQSKYGILVKKKSTNGVKDAQSSTGAVASDTKSPVTDAHSSNGSTAEECRTKPTSEGGSNGDVVSAPTVHNTPATTDAVNSSREASLQSSGGGLSLLGAYSDSDSD